MELRNSVGGVKGRSGGGRDRVNWALANGGRVGKVRIILKTL